jgi:hypothetical protein
MDSDTSSDNVNYLDNDGISLKVEPTNEESTDVYLNMVANNDKLLEEQNNESESFNILSSESEKSNNSIKSDSEPKFETVDLFSSKRKSKRNSQISTKPSKKKSVNNFSESSISSNKSYRSVSSTKSYKSPLIDKKPVLTPQQIRMKKIELLRKLSELKTKGYKLSKEYDFNSTLEEMEYEYDLLKSFADKRNGVKLYKSLIVNFASVAEFVNDKYDPFDFTLDGWSNHLNVEVDNYEEVLEELYEKYKGKGKKMGPEFKLMMLISFSAISFNFSKKHLSNIPGLGKVMENNPDFISNMMAPKPKTSQFMTDQEINIERQKAELRKKEKELKKNTKSHQQNKSNNNDSNVNNFMSKILNDDKNINIDSDNQQPNYTNQQFNLNNQSLNPPRKPDNLLNRKVNTIENNANVISSNDTVENILQRLHNREDNLATDTQESSDTKNRIVSDSYNESDTKKRGRKKKKNLMVIS